MLDAALFGDFDGTRIYGEETFFHALSSALQDHNHPIPTAEIQETLRSGCTWNTPQLSYVDATGQKWWDRLFLHFTGLYNRFHIPSAEYSILNQQFKEEILDAKTYTLYDDALITLQRCRELGFKSYIISNNFPELPRVAEKLGVGALMTGSIISSLIGYEKPREEIFAFARYMADDPNRCYMIGDNPVADIEGGKAAGMTTILVHRQGDFTADYHCHTLSDIPPLLEAGCHCTINR